MRSITIMLRADFALMACCRGLDYITGLSISAIQNNIAMPPYGAAAAH